MISLPYFDMILRARSVSGPAARAFEQFVHWGYWDDASRATTDLEDFSRAMQRMNDELLSAAGIEDGQSILDCGCGFGGTLAAIRASRRDVKLVGVNIDPRQIRVARSQLPPGAQTRFIQADACRVPLAGGSFDRVLAVECIFHFPSRFAFLKEAARVLKPGGRLTLSDFVPRAAGRRSRLRDRLERGLLWGYGTMSSGWPDGNYAEMAEACGLEVSLDRDITPHTLPTYRTLLAMLKRAGGGRRVRLTTQLIQWLSSLGVIQYRIVQLRRR